MTTHTGCEQAYFIEYVLGYKGKSNLAADKGTVFHKIMELLAKAKRAHQDNIDIITDDIVGEIHWHNIDIKRILDKVFEYYSTKYNQHNWAEKDLTDIERWLHYTLTLNGGMFDPRKRNIIHPELHFDFEINKAWANYVFGDISGQLALKGTIDLITDVGNGVYEITDYKTGKTRKDWNTGKEKDCITLKDDPQMRFYHYAMFNQFPNIKMLIATMFFTQAGGPFTVHFTKEDLPETEDMIRKKFEEIRACQKPRLTKTWKCEKLCPYSKIWNEPQIHNIQEFRYGEVTPRGNTMSLCELAKFEIERKGIDRTIKEMTNEGFGIGQYSPPGGE